MAETPATAWKKPCWDLFGLTVLTDEQAAAERARKAVIYTAKVAAQALLPQPPAPVKRPVGRPKLEPKIIIDCQPDTTAAKPAAKRSKSGSLGEEVEEHEAKKRRTLNNWWQPILILPILQAVKSCGGFS